MTTISRTAKAMQQILLRQADQLGWKTGFMERERKLSGSSLSLVWYRGGKITRMFPCQD